MVNFGNFFGARGRAVDPNSDRQLAMACKAQGLVFDKDTKKCRAPLKRGRAPAPGAGPSVASLRAACKAQGLVLDMDTKACRESRRGAGLAAARTARAAALTLAGPTQKDMMAACKAQGLVFDRVTKQCRQAKVRRGKEVDPFSMRQKMLKCKEQGLVFDAVEDKCRPKRTGGRKTSFGVTRTPADQRVGIVHHSPASSGI